MAFAHFHRHRTKYLVLFLFGTLFSLLVFPITRGLNDLAAGLFGRTSGHFVFTTTGGKEVSVEGEALQAASFELGGALGIFAQVGGLDPYASLEKSYRHYAHLILLADAEELGIVAAPGRAAGMVAEFKQFLQQSNPTRQLTVSDYQRMLAQMNLTEERLLVRLGELCQVEAYARAMKGARVLDPVRLAQLAAPKATKVALDWVELSFDKFKEELRATPPADADLETWFKGLAADVIEEKYTRGERFSLDLVLVDAGSFDPAAVPAELVAKVELTDDEYLADGKRDPLRYFGDRAKVPAKAEDLTPEARARIQKDRQLKATFEKLRADFDVAVAALPKLPDPPAPDADDAAKEAAKTALAERAVAEGAEFAKVVARYGFAVVTHADLEMKQLAELDPPKDSSLQFLARGIAQPGASGIRTQSVLPTGDRTFGYVVRLAAATKPSEAKPFAEVKDAVLTQWIDEHAREKAQAKGEELLSQLRIEGEKLLAPEVLAAFQADRDRMTAEIEANKSLTDAEQKKASLDAVQREYVGWISGALGARYGARFREVAQGLGLVVKSAGPHRRDLSTSWYFNDRFSGAERFLFRQNRFATSAQDSSAASLLAMGAGAVLQEVLVDEAGGACYVATVTSSTLPTVDDLTARDRQQAERDLESEWSRTDNPFMRRFAQGTTPACENPFAMVQIARRHHPRVRVNNSSASTSSAGGSPYGY